MTWNDILAFLLEMAAVALTFLSAKRDLGAVTAAGIPVSVIITVGLILLWALFFSQKANFRLKMPWLLIGKAILLGLPGVLFFRANLPLVIFWLLPVVIHLAVGTIQKSL